MVERTVRVLDPAGQTVEGINVDIAESTERFSDVTLTDGTLIRAKLVVVAAVRLPEQWDSDGNPMYILKSQNVVAVASSPDQLKRRTQ